jgi:hypothetical protein
VLRRSPAQLAANGKLIATVGVVAAEEGVVDEPVARMLLRGEPHLGALTDGAGDDAVHGPRVVVTELDAAARFELLGRCACSDVDEPGQSVRAVARSLRAAKHLDLLDVEQGCGRRRDGQIHTVHDQADRRIQRLGELAALADAANLKEPAPRGASGDVDVRCQGENVLQVTGPARFDRLALHDGDTRR